MQTIQAIPTRFAGCHFRSRLEARWAVWLDTVRLEWKYEPQGFNLGREGYYLPDFYIPELDCYLEVKPQEPDGGDKPCRQAAALAALTGRAVWMVFDPNLREFNRHLCYDVRAFHWDTVGKFTMRRAFELLAPRPVVEALPEGASADEIRAWFTGLRRRHDAFNSKHKIETDGRWLIEAFRAFRSARFEHGESGAT